ncbi:alpha/beta hydrolase [Leifsonia sp. Le1]|uniref:alpha/beta hydrolase n=1 Tax=Leifsonia sp. Le1 TaxID=3404918 RepID=UPI003EBBF6C9
MHTGMRVVFDDGAADSLIRVASSGAQRLRDQAGERRSSAEGAAADFSGAFGRLFEQACGAESEDRIRLAVVLEELAAGLAEAKVLAQREKDRLTAVAQWRVREDQRVRDRAADPTGLVHADSGLTDPEPSAVAVAPPTVSAAFASRERRRTADGSAKGKTSADPVALRGFVTRSRALNAVLESEVAAVRNAWAGFAAGCSWVRVGTVTFTGGFERMLAENHADATWIERVAAQFEKAGGGTLSHTVLNKAARSTVLDVAKGTAFQNFLNGNLSPAEAAAYWNSLGLDVDEIRLLPPETLLRLSSLPGLPAAAQDAASREFLKYALKHPEDAYRMMGFADPWKYPLYGSPIRRTEDLDIQQFTDQLHAIDDALKKAAKDAKNLPGNPVVQLIGLGAHDGALVAAVSFGDLDTASHVGVNVSGMNSNVGDMEYGNDAAALLYERASRKNPFESFAVVNWIGYRSPTTVDEVHGMDRAESGGRQLTDFLNGIHASRHQSGVPIEQFNVYAHSYGSTVAVEALKHLDFDIDVLATYGSAGVKNGTTTDQLHAKDVLATHAKGDGIAKLGQHGGKSLDPRDIAGVKKFSAEDSVSADGKKLKRTTMHDMYQEEDTWSLSNMWAGTVGYLSPDATAQDQMSRMLATGAK